MLILSVMQKLLKVMQCNPETVEDYEGSCSFAYKVVCTEFKFSNPIVVYRGKNATYEFIKAIFKEYKYCKKKKKERKKNTSRKI